MNVIRVAVAFAATIALTGCSVFGPKPEVVHHKPNIESTASKIVLMPVSDFDGAKTGGAEELDEALMTGWTKTFGAKIVPAGPAVEELNKQMGKGYVKILKSIKRPSKATKLKKDPLFAEYIQKLGDIAGDNNFGFSVIEGGKDEYDAGQPVTLYLALFDTKSFQWKWITRTINKKGMLGNWESASLTLVSNSLDVASQADTSKESLARKPASK